jgi:hypothetical protein
VDVLLCPRLRGQAVPKQRQHCLEAEIGNVLELMPPHDQPTPVAVDMAQPGFGNNDIIKTRVHGIASRNSCSVRYCPLRMTSQY